MNEDYDMYGVPYQDGDPLLGLAIVIVLIIIFYVGTWIIDKINKII